MDVNHKPFVPPTAPPEEPQQPQQPVQPPMPPVPPMPPAPGPEPKPKKSKILTIIIIALVVLILGLILVIVATIVNRNNEAERLRREKELQEQLAAEREEARRDSLMRNFVSADLKVCQLKGYVRSMTTTISGDQRGPVVYTFEFSTNGTLTSATYSADGSTVPIVPYSRAGALRELSITGKYYGTSHSELDNFKLKYGVIYNTDLNVSKITFENEGWESGAKGAYVFSGFNGRGYPSAAQYTCTFEGEGNKTEASGTEYISYGDYDSNDNWISATWSGTINYKDYEIWDYDYELAGSYSENVTERFTRTITYYTKYDIFGN